MMTSGQSTAPCPCRTAPRLLIKYKYPPDKQPATIRQVIDQMEALAPKYAEERRGTVVQR
jgi:type I restriction enzyme R subunit